MRAVRYTPKSGASATSTGPLLSPRPRTNRPFGSDTTPPSPAAHGFIDERFPSVGGVEGFASLGHLYLVLLDPADEGLDGAE